MPRSHRHLLKRQGIELLILPATPTGHVDISALLTELGQRQIISLLVEGGGKVLGTCFEANIVNEVWAFLAPLIIGGQEAQGPVGGRGFATLADACRLKNVTVQTHGSDLLVHGLIS
jgi:diaminohydroxyphosphoribosylaminopyrimidine deaminase/5-amino-6-(5-phosphoribosylamino)uracil reductase